MSGPLALLSVRGLAKVYADARGQPRPVLQGVSFELQAGELVAIVGESGVGKSTLLNLVGGLEVADAGELLLEGRDLTRLDDETRTRVRREQLGFIFQAFHVLPHLNVLQNVLLPGLLVGRESLQQLQPRARALLAGVGLAGRDEDSPMVLSGGELQRVAIARALLHRPRLVLADEPTGNLDPETASRVLDLLQQQLREAGAACLLVTHSQEAAARADRCLRLDRHGIHPA